MMMQDIAVDLCCFPKAVGPNFARPKAPSAARYTGDTLRGEDASTNDTVQHIALGREIEGNWWTLFRSDAIDQLVKQAVEHNRSLVASMAALAQAQELALAQAGLRYPQVDLQSQAQQAAQSSLDLARASYREGNAGVLLVLDAERSCQQARLGYVGAVVQRYRDTVQLFLALGGTSPSGAPVAVASSQPGALQSARGNRFGTWSDLE